MEGQAAWKVAEDRVGQEQAGPDQGNEWFLKICLPSELERGIKLARISDT